MERQVILERIEQIRKETQNFNQQTMRWKNRTFNDVPYNKVDFASLNSVDLVQSFEMMLLFHYRQG